ncbi:MAG: aminomethyl-transferring glycine dehydrogenase subunit GcvPA [Candidatus Kapaibacteriales bacterium]
MPFVPHSEQDVKEMFETIGVENFEQMVGHIPDSVRYRGLLDFPRQLSEYEAYKLLKEYSQMNNTSSELVSFQGGGAYDRFIPAIVPETMIRPEFRTAYTPYQSEVSQGTLQAMYEFQTMIANLYGMDVANASMYEAGSSLAEAAFMALATNKQKKILIAGSMNPNYLETIKTLTAGREMTVEVIAGADGKCNIEMLKEAYSDDVSCIMVQQPNFYGNLEDVYEIEKIAHSGKSLYIVCADPISLNILEAPGSYNADIAVGEGQPLGLPLSYGGPYLGLFCCKQEFLRKLPGRIAGLTTDMDGNPGFTLTLQTREQQIKREKATSNICTNQGLFMLAATVYMSTMGKSGLKEVAELSYQNTRYIYEGIKDKYEFVSGSPFFFEFAIKVDNAKELIRKGKQQGMLIGTYAKAPDGSDSIIISATEKRLKSEADALIDFLNS